MSTRYTKRVSDDVSVSTGLEGSNVPEDFSIPPCTIEDIDRAFFNLFNDEIPFFYKINRETRRVPVIFATGERFAILRRKRPLRDDTGALILPLISMQRQSVVQDPTKGAQPGQNVPIVIKTRLDKADVNYQRLINKDGLKNQDNTASPTHMKRHPDMYQDGSGSVSYSTKPGQVATRRNQSQPGILAQKGQLLRGHVGKNIYEIITIPPTKFFTVSYEVTFWAQYTQQMNRMMMALMSSYQDNNQRTFRIETDKGYWFVAYVDAEISSLSNFDDFSDSERLVRCSFTASVPGYVINADFDGAMTPFRSFATSPDVTFEILENKNELVQTVVNGPPSSDPSKYILSDLDEWDSDYPSDAIGGGAAIASSFDARLANGIAIENHKTVNIGGAIAGKSLVSAPKMLTDPFTGEKYKESLSARQKTTKGETIYKDPNSGKINPNFDFLENLDM